MLLDMEDLLKMIKLILQTGYILNERSGSLLILAQPESAKTSAMLEFGHIKGTYVTNVLSQKVIADKILPMIEMQGLKHIIIPDILNCLGKAKATRVGFENMIKSLIEEGITSLDSFHIKSNKVYNPPIKCGLITAITTQSYDGYFNPLTQRTEGGLKHAWKKTGLLSRFTPISYKFPISKVMKIFKFIAEETHKEKPVKHSIKRTPIDVKGKSSLFLELNLISAKIGKQSGGYGIRMFERLKVLTKANARLRGNVVVDREDIEEIFRLGNWINYDFNPM